MRNTADVIGGKSIAVLLQSISGVSAINPLVAFFDIHGGKREVLLFYYSVIYFILLLLFYVFTPSINQIVRSDILFGIWTELKNH
jgi:hypothetical protein